MNAEGTSWRGHLEMLQLASVRSLFTLRVCHCYDESLVRHVFYILV